MAVGDMYNSAVLSIYGDLSAKNLEQIGVLLGDNAQLCIADSSLQNGMITTSSPNTFDICDATQMV